MSTYPDARSLPEARAGDRALLSILGALRATGYGFVTPTPATIARVNARPGNERARDLAGVFGWSRPFAAELLSSDLMASLCAAEVLTPVGPLWRSRVRVSSLGDDLFLHSAYPTEAADSVFFGPDTYRFAAAIRAGIAAVPRPTRRAVDIGCGAGPGGILIGKLAREADVVLVDINATALRYARLNAQAAGVSRADAVHSDLLSGVDGDFDLIVSNPPYLNDPLRRAYRHGGGPLGAGLSLSIAESALDRLAPAGRLILYTGVAIVDGQDPFRAAVSERFGSRIAWSYDEVDPDVFGEELETPAYGDADRIAAVVLTAMRHG